MQHEFTELCSRVQHIGYRRDVENLPRRLMKMLEELGEYSEAYLNVTSDVNAKNKTWDDVREEALDCLIVILDCALTQIGNECPTAAILPALIERGYEMRIEPKNTIDITMRISRSVTRAYGALCANQPMSLYGALSKAIVDISYLVYFDYPTHGDDPVLSSVHVLTDRKLSKWTNALKREKEFHEAA